MTGFEGNTRFEMIRQIGRGGMGIVYEALDKERNYRVAVKVLPHTDARSLYLFKQEFRALADVVHRNLVALHELISTGDRWLLVMEYVDGVNFIRYARGLSRGCLPIDNSPHAYQPSAPGMEAETKSTNLAEEEGTDSTKSYVAASPIGPSTPPLWSSSGPTLLMKLSPATSSAGVSDSGQNAENSVAPLAPLETAEQFRFLRDALCQLIDGLGALHAAGKLHRDIKPSNVLVTPEGRVVILDFGLVADLERHSGAEHGVAGIVGTYAYMAPEQVLGKPLTAASDWYSVGVMLYKTITGRLPFVGQGEERTDFVPVSVLAPGLPLELARCCDGLLQRNPEDRPTPAQLRVWLRPEADSAPCPADSPKQEVIFIGRERELATLEEAVARVVAGQTAAVTIHGRSGVGKSSLVQQFLDGLAERPNTLILCGRCYERESVPYKGIDSLIDALSSYLRNLNRDETAVLLPPGWRALTRMFPVLYNLGTTLSEQGPFIPDPRELRRHAFAALRELLCRLGRKHLLLLAIDDLQWGDADSAMLLAELLVGPNAPRLCLLCAYRSEYTDSSPALAALRAALNTAGVGAYRRDVPIEPLGFIQAAELAEALLWQHGLEARVLSEAVAREAHGNPYFIRELVQYIKGQNIQPGCMPATQVALEQVLRQRILELSEPARRLLEVVAVSGRPLPQGVAFRAGDLPVADPALLHHLRVARLIRGTGAGEHDQIETYHDRIREVILAYLSADQLRHHELQLALTLEATPEADAETIAIHFRGAGDHAKAGLYYRRAADEAAAALAFERAVSLYQVALEFRSPTGEEALDLHTRLAEALANAGRCPEAGRHYQRAASFASPDQALALRNLAAGQYLFSGHIEEGMRELEELLRATDIRYPASRRGIFLELWLRLLWLRLRLLTDGLMPRNARVRGTSKDHASLASLRCEICSTAGGGLSRHDYLRALYFSVRGLQLALRVGEPDRIAMMLTVVAMGISPSGAPNRRYAGILLETAERLAKDAATPLLEGQLAVARGLATYMMGDYRNARSYAAQAEEILRDRCTGAIFHLTANRIHWHWALLFLGEFAELRRLTPAQVQDAEQRGDYSFTALAQAFVLPYLHLADDDPAGARRTVAESLAHPSMRPSHALRMLPVLGQLAIELYESRGTAPWDYLCSQWPSWLRSDAARGQSACIEMHYSRARCALAAAPYSKDARRLYRVADQEARWLERQKLPRIGPLAGLIRAALARIAGQHAAAVQLLKAALAGFEQEGMGLHVATTRRRLGELIGGTEGDMLIAEADTWMTQQTIRNPAAMTQMLAPGLFKF